MRIGLPIDRTFSVFSQGLVDIQQFNSYIYKLFQSHDHIRKVLKGFSIVVLIPFFNRSDVHRCLVLFLLFYTERDFCIQTHLDSKKQVTFAHFSWVDPIPTKLQFPRHADGPLEARPSWKEGLKRTFQMVS